MAMFDAGTEIEIRQPIRQGDDRGPETWVPDWLTELREMRGRIWYDNGRRPFFRKSDGSFIDVDPADIYAYHIIARREGRPIGCSRIVPLCKGRPSFVVEHLGEERVARIVEDFGARRERACEASRWVVVPEHRYGLGATIVAITWMAARHLGFDVAFVLACTSQGQDRALRRFGARVVEGEETFWVEDFLEHGRLLYIDAANPSASMSTELADLKRELNLDAVLEPRRLASVA